MENEFVVICGAPYSYKLLAHVPSSLPYVNISPIQTNNQSNYKSDATILVGKGGEGAILGTYWMTQDMLYSGRRGIGYPRHRDF